jgi:hypothetical protein
MQEPKDPLPSRYNWAWDDWLVASRQGILGNGLTEWGNESVKLRIHEISVTEYYENDLTSVDGVDSAIRSYSQRPDVSVAIQLMGVEARARMTGILLE